MQSVAAANGGRAPSQSQSVTLKNASALPLQFVLKCAPPFSVDTCERALLPNEEVRRCVFALFKVLRALLCALPFLCIL